MKIFLSAIFCFVSSFLFSQKTYHFDNYLGYTSEIKRNKEISSNEFYSLINSKNQSYKAKIIKGEKTRSGVMIADYPNDILYYFDLKNENFPLKNEDFIYVKSEKLKNVKKQFEDEFNNRVITAVPLYNDGIIFNYEIKESKKADSKKYSTKALVSFHKYKDDLAFVGLENLLDFYGVKKKISLPENMILTSATSEFDGATKSLELKVIEPVEIIFTVE
ncbi:hypothetical protein SAMN05421796_10339 [Chryseobacterium piscicola]|uniref:Uncharacterized protein n=1 Tax=Chryseobacterium piscicola TaxID=551459 RepID=A0A1N7LS18_9FLAO|nr:hypothetical protein [Chryseobacterium piscicola]PQA91824.1 hypothetical protein B0A70_12075 [Chryseobacterium piscicola]SIS76626.1 hypothetical protein SAMN05421796_10339 [Chryseobacterium piscicola]